MKTIKFMSSRESYGSYVMFRTYGTVVQKKINAIICIQFERNGSERVPTERNSCWPLFPDGDWTKILANNSSVGKQSKPQKGIIPFHLHVIAFPLNESSFPDSFGPPSLSFAHCQRNWSRYVIRFSWIRGQPVRKADLGCQRNSRSWPIAPVWCYDTCTILCDKRARKWPN